jgi:hypothetical protein
MQPEHRVAVTGIWWDDVQQDLPDRDACSAYRCYHAHAIAGSEVARLHLTGTRLHDHVSRSQRAQHHCHALEHAERTGKLSPTELHHESAG